MGTAQRGRRCAPCGDTKAALHTLRRSNRSRPMVERGNRGGVSRYGVALAQEQLTNNKAATKEYKWMVEQFPNFTQGRRRRSARRRTRRLRAHKQDKFGCPLEDRPLDPKHGTP